MRRLPENRHRHRMIVVTVILATVVAMCSAAVFAAKEVRDRHASEPRGDFLPKDVPQTPAASPLASPPPEADLVSGAVTVNLAAGSPVGPDTTVSGTANAPNGVVYYRISDYRRGQIATGQVNVTPASAAPFKFKPEFSRVYTVGDPAALDIYVLNPNGAERTTRVEVKLQ